MPDVSLVYVPFGALERPSLALGLLKAGLTQRSIDCEVRYTTFDFAERVGLELYSKLAWVREEMLGEWVFAHVAFPHFKPEREDYLDRVLDSFYAVEDEKGREFGRSYLLFARHEAEAFIEQQSAAVLSGSPRIVAVSSTFNQNCAMLALTRRIKALAPHVTTVVGGANCEGTMGVAMARHFPWLDYVVSGEGETVFPQLCERLLSEAGEPPTRDLPYGVLASRAVRSALPMVGSAAPATPPRSMEQSLEDCPIPDFDDYFDSLAAYRDRDCITPGLVVETARGCWWGAVHHCTFCGLNGGAMTFRAKTAERVQFELRTLSSRYGLKRFLVADNILDQAYYRDLLPALADLPDEDRYELYLEIKANVNYSQLEALHAAGARWLVAGIESLHDDVLRLMDKGTWGWLNLQVLKWSRGLGIHISWNMLCGLPGERDEWFREMAELLPLVSHLEPPNDVRAIRFDRFSPYQARPQDFGLSLSPSWPYSYLYPFDQSALQDLVYFFETAGQDPVHLNPFRHGLDVKDNLPSLGGPGRDALQDEVRRWVRLFRSPDPAVLRMTEEADRTTILDTRPVAPSREVVLAGLAHRVHRACDRAATVQRVHGELITDGGSPVRVEEVQRQLDALVEARLLVRLGQRYLALAVRGEMPNLPWKNEEGYPGGWFVYPRPPRFPAALEEFMNRRSDPAMS
ncbi:RiPP maturation radical SAM C-methyltransferase [Streptomyces sp. NPDC060028]|uniref:RiPP maturation radical SAM C-methyltransferase n=1 Tax=Streptomyces sp. NPDC060028 TaxID=3347041 RepID=UPI00367D658D